MITDANISRLVAELDERKARGGDHTSVEGKAKASSEAIAQKTAAHTAAVIGTSERKVEKTRTVLKHTAPEVKAAVLAGEKSINAAYKQTQATRKVSHPATGAPAAASAPAKPAPKQRNGPVGNVRLTFAGEFTAFCDA